MLSDGSTTAAGILASQLAELVDQVSYMTCACMHPAPSSPCHSTHPAPAVAQGQVKVGTIARLTAYVANKINDTTVMIMVTDLEVGLGPKWCQALPTLGSQLLLHTHNLNQTNKHLRAKKTVNQACLAQCPTQKPPTCHTRHERGSQCAASAAGIPAALLG